MRLEVSRAQLEKLRFGSDEASPLDQVFRNGQAIVDRAVGPGCQTCLRQKS